MMQSRHLARGQTSSAAGCPAARTSLYAMRRQLQDSLQVSLHCAQTSSTQCLQKQQEQPQQQQIQTLLHHLK
jgi:hypothetical protein